MSILDRARANAQANAQAKAEAEYRELQAANEGRMLAEAAMRQRMAQQVPVDITPRSPGLAESVYERDAMEVGQALGARPAAVGGRLPNAVYSPEEFRQKFGLR